MRWVSILLIAAACKSTNYISFGPEVEAEVQKVLDAEQKAEAALANGRATYWMPAPALVPERNALMAALRATPYTKHQTPLEKMEAEIPHDVEVVFSSDDRVVAWLRSEVFEAAYPEGTLHVERHEFFGDGAHYRISLIQGNRSLYAGAKSGPRIDNAWRRLSNAAMRRAGLRIDGGPGSRERPLASMRDVGVDFRGIAAE